MKSSGRVQSCCITLFLALTSVSALQKLNSINDLKKVNFGQSVPKHSLLLLHWFANVIDIDNNNVIRLTFNPNQGDYGSHHYGNFERVLDPLPSGHQYFTLGNLHQGTSQLPDYVVHPQSEYTGRNMDRIIFRIRQQNTGRQALQRIDQVYITQHYEASEQQGTRYDPDHTYQVTTNLLRQIREFSVGEDQQSLSQLRNCFGSNSDDFQLRHIKNIWGDLACLGLLLFIVIQEKYSYKQPNKKPERSARRNPQPDFVVNIPENRQNPRDDNTYNTSRYERDEIQLEVTTGINGKARIHWSNIPKHRLNEGVMVVLFKNNRDQEVSGTYRCIGNKESGSYDTSVLLNEGLQVRLHKVRRRFCFCKVTGEEICRGPEFKNFKAGETVNIAGYNAKLQLFVKDGKACARLFVKRTFHEWRSEFKNSWVGFYASADKDTNQYEWWQWQWATKFRPSTDVVAPSHDVYDYHSGLAIASGVQARFILSGNVAASTPSWR
uniref:uncharacterized protein LOC122784776 n=1 Tax=Solea senegalensis TaxID=28829 RepID=UPI001CD86E86|nr:uncharacterized protein LOC122784776 [Solea senegalensis]